MSFRNPTEPYIVNSQERSFSGGKTGKKSICFSRLTVYQETTEDVVMDEAGENGENGTKVVKLLKEIKPPKI